MSYDNNFSLKIHGDVSKPTTFCPKCKIDTTGKFCSNCGTEVVVVMRPCNKNEIIKELRDWSDDCSYLLTENGRSMQSGSGYNIEEDIQKFSLRYPDLTFQLDCVWDSGFGDDDEDGGAPTRYFWKNGKKREAKAKVVYEEPNFDD